MAHMPNSAWPQSGAGGAAEAAVVITDAAVAAEAAVAALFSGSDASVAAVDDEHEMGASLPSAATFPSACK